MTSLALRATAIALVLLAGAAARAEPPSKEAAATMKVRAALPAPGDAFTFSGAVWVEGLWSGTLKWSAEAGSFAEKPAWLVREDLLWDYESNEWSLGATYTLGTDLTLLRAEVTHKAKDVATHWNLSKTAKGLTGQKQVVKAEGEGPFEEIALAAPEGTTAGYAAVALLMRGPLPSGEKALELPWLDPAAWGGTAPLGAAKLKLALTGEAKFEEAPTKPESLAAKLTGCPVEGTWHVSKKDRALLGFSGLLAAKSFVLPEGETPTGKAFDEKAPSRTWQDAFLKFGIGYHMAREEVLASAFHWQEMYDYETSLVDGWPAEKPLAEFKKAWIDAFISESKHRARGETDELLRMTLATGKVEKKGDDRIVFHAHKQFGGGIQRDYHLRRIEGVWGITRIDINE